MGTVLHLETEVGVAVSQAMQRTAQEMEALTAQLRREQYRLYEAWMGMAAERFLGDLSRLLERLEDAHFQLHDLSTRLAAEIKEWEEADRRFGSGALSSYHSIEAEPSGILPGVQQIQMQICGHDERCKSKWKHPPQDAEDLAYLTMSLPKEMPFVIMGVGDNEYLVMLRGTTDSLTNPSGWFSEGTDWDQNLPAFLGVSSLYQNDVVKAILASVPLGAKLHFSGHSQGGMVAQNLAVDPRLKDYQLASVTMFGSPTTLAPRNSHAKYVSYEAAGDVVPKLDEIIWPQAPLAAALVTVKQSSIERHIFWKPRAARSPDPKVSHSVYGNEGVLRGYPMGLKLKKGQAWTSVVTGHRIPGVAEQSKATIAGILHRVQRAAKHVIPGQKAVAAAGSGSW